MVGAASAFPIPFVENFRRFPLDPSNPKLSDKQKEDLQYNIQVSTVAMSMTLQLADSHTQLLRDVLILFTATGAARGVSGHTGGPYDTIPEVCILLSLFEGDKEGKQFLDTIFDEAGHRCVVLSMPRVCVPA